MAGRSTPSRSTTDRVPHLVSNGALVIEDLRLGARRDEPALFHLLNLARERRAYVAADDAPSPVERAADPHARPDVAPAPRAERLARSAGRRAPQAVLVKLFVDRQLVVDTTRRRLPRASDRALARRRGRGRGEPRPRGLEPRPAHHAADGGRDSSAARPGRGRTRPSEPVHRSRREAVVELPRTERRRSKRRATVVRGDSGRRRKRTSEDARQGAEADRERRAEPVRAEPARPTARRCASRRSASSTASCPGCSSTAASSRRPRTATIRCSSSCASCRSRPTTSTSSSWSASPASSGQVRSGVATLSQDGLTPAEQLARIARRGLGRSPPTSSGAGASSRTISSTRASSSSTQRR